jgi:hypothetical protein
MGVNRQKFGDTIVRLDADVTEVFISAESVNEALPFLIIITKENQGKFEDLLIK